MIKFLYEERCKNPPPGATETETARDKGVFGAGFRSPLLSIVRGIARLTTESRFVQRHHIILMENRFDRKKRVDEEESKTDLSFL